ncbi:glycoside hydrolase family 16 protein [Punctularia strigosozonata HHB-11173 SS5]|uniref:glycoside hydrolase family 16 protein n=1 Tax=Punctularia strigosozonata (strain HHB-11173) TaxID=741275 RepID=UPI0004417DE6|nr:glycoside hydrolase family 16 protein [Punctularia strigosozonata HHB-11173 SS5]EIN09353.1 glycoside hydrolase family 16 protein [Punctularia strigosozonata HHB-11173 SS5]
MKLSIYISAALAATCNTLAASYSRKSNVVGNGFYDFFSFQAVSDPTNGRVNYVNKATAQSQNLTYASSDTFILRADYKNTLSASGPGRNSARIQSNNAYSTHVAIFNIRHMPQGCGTWPAIWEVGPNWPNEGEVDILEGVNDVGPNQATLHTGAGYTMPSSQSAQNGRVSPPIPPWKPHASIPTLRISPRIQVGTDCEGSTGCGVQERSDRSYGPAFNGAGGGWYAMERTSSSIKVWFWSRLDTSVPAEVKNGATSIDTSSWGTPFAYFSGADCDIDSKFGPNQIIINLTFCGDWAGSAYGSSGCPGTCVDYVNNNPSAFQNAYFDLAWMNIYQ